MRAIVSLPRDAVQDTLDVMHDNAIDGSRSEAVLRLTGSAASRRKLMQGEDAAPLDVFQDVYRDLAARVAYVPDPYGEELVQSPEFTLERGAGDCDDATVLVLAVARALGIRGAMVVLSAPDGEGGLTALHVFPELEFEAGTWTPADLSESLPIGEAPQYPSATSRERIVIDPPSPSGLGFLDGLFTAVASIFTAKDNRKAAERVAEGQEAAARSAVEAAKVNRAANEDTADAVRDAARYSAIVGAGQVAQQRRSVAESIQFLRDVFPAIALLALARWTAPIVLKAVSSGGRARKRAPRKAAA